MTAIPRFECPERLVVGRVAALPIAPPARKTKNKTVPSTLTPEERSFFARMPFASLMVSNAFAITVLLIDDFL